MFLQNSQKKLLKKLQKKIFVNRYGVDTNLFKNNFKNKNILKKKKKFIVIYVGGFTYQKGSHYLIKAMNKLTTKYDIEFWHVGMIEKELINIIKRYSNSKMKFFGQKPFKELPKYFSKASIFCIPSIHDGLALVIPQALSSGLPVLCTENSGGKEYIINNYNGFIIKPFSSREIYKN